MECKEAFKIAKTMKRNFIYVTPTRMYGMDIGKSTLSIIDMISNVPVSFAGEISAILDENKKEKFLVKNTSTFLYEYKKLEEDMYINFWEEPSVINDIMNAYNSLSNILSRRSLNPTYSVSGLENNISFMNNTYAIKVVDGYQKMVMDGYYLDCFSKMHCISKADKVSLNVYDKDPFFYIYEFIVSKKKYEVKEYFKIRKMHRY